MKKRIITSLLAAIVAVSSMITFNVTANAADNVVASGVWYESAYVEWTGSPNTTYTASWKESSAADTEYKAVDAELIREVNPGEYRVDVLGLKGGVSYDVLVKNGEETVTKYSGKPMAYDRSGFAFDDEVRCHDGGLGDAMSTNIWNCTIH